MKQKMKWNPIILVLMILALVTNGFALAEEENTGTVVCVTGLPDPENIPLPEDGTVIDPGFIPASVDVAVFDDEDDEEAPQEGYVFDEDDREQIWSTWKYPYVAVAYMEIHCSCGCESTGTGFMVAKDKLMTAAHCIICSEHQAWADGITFYFGYDSGGYHTYTYNGRWYAFVGTTFPDGYTTDNDWAVVKLYKNVGETVGWFGLKYNMPDKDITSKLLRLLGYKWGALKISSGFATTGSGNLLLYTIDIEHGNSGGPVFYLDHGDPYAVAINIADNDQTNFGYRITDMVYRYLLELDNY